MNASTPDTETITGTMSIQRIGTGSIHARVARVQATVRNMPKDKTAVIKSQRTGTEYSFDYITKGALEAECRQLLSAEGVAIYVTEDSIEQTGNRCRVTVAITLACDRSDDHDTNREQTVVIKRSGYGNADDDKGPAKAGTTAVRLALADLLLQGGDDVAEHDYVEFRPEVAGQALQPGDRAATPNQIRTATDYIMRAQLDKAMPSEAHALLRLARPIAQSEIGPGLEVVEAIRLIPMAVMSKLIERIEPIKPAAAKQVWDQVAEWEAANGYSSSVEPEDTKLPVTAPILDADGNPIPF